MVNLILKKELEVGFLLTETFSFSKPFWGLLFIYFSSLGFAALWVEL